MKPRFVQHVIKKHHTKSFVNSCEHFAWLQTLLLSSCFMYPSVSCKVPMHQRLTFLTGGSREARLAVTDRVAALRQATLAMSAALPPAGWRLLPPIAVLTLETFAALTTVGVAHGHAHAMSTSESRVKRESDGEIEKRPERKYLFVIPYKLWIGQESEEAQSGNFISADENERFHINIKLGQSQKPQ